MISRRPQRLGARFSPLRAAGYALLGLWSAVVLLPLYWLAITSLKKPFQVNDGPYYLPFVDFTPSLHAWRYLLVDLRGDTLRPFFNSLTVSLFSTVLAVFVGAMAAYGLSRFRYRVRLSSVGLFLCALALAVAAVAYAGVHWAPATAAALALFILSVRACGTRFRRAIGNQDILFWLISQRILPPVAVVIPIYIMFQQLNLLDTVPALVATYATINLPIVVWIMYDFFNGIPRDLEESAAMDGASRMRIFLSVVLPLARVGLAAAFLLVWILSWNEYLLALFLSTADAQTMPLLVAAQNATRGPQWWYMSTLIMIMIVPVIILAILLMRLIRRGFLAGAVKG